MDKKQVRMIWVAAFSIVEFSVGEVLIAIGADPLSGITAAEGWLLAVWAELFVHISQLLFL
ncbi:hypothetical protein ACIQXV_05790 [Neobacillus sp. NPDC097160]|uniref:hypothetical protein n=1 Tax=Neobacillus sp. NPDC097160 TaxID=3364298 RepID=UPI0038240148